MTDNTSKIEEKLSDNANLKMDIKLYWRFWSFVVKKQLLVFVGYAVFLVVMASLTPIFTVLWKTYLDKAAESLHLLSAIWTLVLYLIVKIILDFCYFFSMRFMDRINFSSWRILDKAINQKAATLYCEYMEIPNVQNRINRAWEFNHGSYIQLYQLGLDTVRYITQAAGVFVSLYIIHPMICCVALITVIPSIVSKLVRDKESILNKREMADDENELNYYKNAIFDQDLIKEITLKNAFHFFENKYRVKSKEIFDKKRSCEAKKIRLLFFEEIVRNIVILVCFMFAGYQFLLGETSLGGLAAVFSIITNLVYTLTNLVQNGCSIFTLTYNIKQFYEFMDLDSTSLQKGNSISEGVERIDFVDVSYRYPLTDKYILKHVNISIKKGQHIAIVGANGSGKSTFVKLLLKLLEPSTGEIRVNGMNLKNVACEEYWRSFSSVFQDYGRFKETLRYNVSISDMSENKNDEKIKDALMRAEFDKDIKLECILSKEFGGIELSGGEWQKIALARVIYCSNDIYILDEPTAAIDPIKETEIYKHFCEITNKKTSIFVTHRLGSVLYSDLVFFFRNGEIAEIGTHDELLSKKGAYFDFWNAQLSLYKL